VFPRPLQDEIAALTKELPLAHAKIARLRQQIADINADIDTRTGFRPGAEADYAALDYDKLGDPSVPICLAAGTPVQTPDGPRAIDTLRPGDAVFTFDQSRGSTVVRPVVRVFRNWTDLVVDLRFGKELLQSTRGHPFATAERGWQPARSLRPGERVLARDGCTVELGASETVALVVETYNLEVADHHCFYVGLTGVLAHNVDENRNWTNAERSPTRIYVIVDRSQLVEIDGVLRPKVIYVGKTFQGEAGDVRTRFRGHLAAKPHWKLRVADLDVLPVDEYLGLSRAIEGDWTRFEAAVWEQHFVNLFGGKSGSHRPNRYHAELENDVNAITPDKFEQFREGYGHNPCR
jgi:hypothetical protein